MTDHKHEWNVSYDGEVYCTVKRCDAELSMVEISDLEQYKRACEELSAEDARGVARLITSEGRWGVWERRAGALRAYADKREGL